MIMRKVGLDQTIVREPPGSAGKPATDYNGQTDAVNHLTLDLFKPLVVNFYHGY